MPPGDPCKGSGHKPAEVHARTLLFKGHLCLYTIFSLFFSSTHAFRFQSGDKRPLKRSFFFFWFSKEKKIPERSFSDQLSECELWTNALASVRLMC